MPPEPRDDRPSGGKGLAAVAGVGALALLLRLVYLHQTADLPLVAVPLADAKAYLDWARSISGGDVWSRAQGTFYQAPLYPYLLALLQTLAGEGGEAADRTLVLVRWVQAGFGALSCVLLTVAGGRWFGRRAGIAAGCLLAAYPPGLFFDGLINKTSLAQVLLCGLLALLSRWNDPPGAGLRIAVGAGAVLGLLALTRENALLLLPVLVIWAALHRSSGDPGVDTGGSDPSGRRRRAAALLVGCGLVLLPVALRNLAVGGSFAVTTSQAGPNFYIGNRAGASGSYTPLRTGRSDTPFERRDAVELAEADEGRALTPSEVSAYWFTRARRDIAADPLRWLRLMLRKTWMVGHRYEVPDVEDLYLFAEEAWILGVLLPWLHLGVLVPLAILGLGAAWGDRRRISGLLWILLTLVAGVAAFYVFARYRYPIVPPLALLAGVALAKGTAGPRAWALDRRPLAAALALAAVAAVTVNLPSSWLLGRDPLASRAMAHVNAGVALVDLGRYDEAIDLYRRAATLDPSLVEARLGLGSTLLFIGQLDDAVDHLLAAAELSPGDAEIQHQLGQAYRSIALARARPAAMARATHHLRRALDLDPAFALAALDLAALLDAGGDGPDGTRVLQDALSAARDRGEEGAVSALSRALGSRQGSAI
ncbi:MAG: tetratricopeptide repeat protein [Acidobacteriota bacterium]